MARLATTRTSHRASPRSRMARRSARSSAGTRAGRRPRRRTAGRRRATRRGSRQPIPPRGSRGRPAEPGLQSFLDRFAEALTSGDGRDAARLFEYPSLMVMSDARKYGPSVVLSDEEQVAAFFDRAPEMYNSRGVYETFPDIRAVDRLAPDLIAARVRFPYIDGDGNDMGDGEESVYLLRRAGRARYAIAGCVTLGVDGERRKGGTGRQGRRAGRTRRPTRRSRGRR